MKTCTDCILDLTDACPRGAGRAVDDSICSDFLEDTETKFGKWIPVSERLPEESLDSVIGWDAYRERPVFVEYYNGRFHWRGICLESLDIKAWMLLPEPYKAESKDT